MDNKIIKITEGVPARGDDFFNREDALNDIWKVLEQSSILLIGPRRFGKTSVMRRLWDNPEKEYIPIFLDIEYVESPEEFILVLIDEIKKNETTWNKVKLEINDFFKVADDKIEEVGISSIQVKLRKTKDKNWKNLGSHLIDLMTKNEKKILFIFDEFPEMIKLMIRRDKKNNTNETELFLRWFRAIRQNASKNLKLRFIVGGSLCLENLLRQINSIPQINDLHKIKVGAFWDEEAIEFIKALFAGENKKIDDIIPNTILKHIGTPIPYFIQLMVGALVRESRNLKKEITEEFVKEVYENYLLDSDFKSCFEHYHLRLSEYYENIGGEKDMVVVAKAILTELSIQESISKVELYNLYLRKTNLSDDMDEFGCLMLLLEDEFYLEYNPETESYCFLSKLLKDWWYRHFGMLKKYNREI
ncbi:MAG: AAA family ATPase [Candidatus Aenigmarchaeota archaeon]|nr:AAA family ATPase [Candidatus Aenigmarchaeota archaeon]